MKVNVLMPWKEFDDEPIIPRLRRQAVTVRYSDGLSRYVSIMKLRNDE